MDTNILLIIGVLIVGLMVYFIFNKYGKQYGTKPEPEPDGDFSDDELSQLAMAAAEAEKAKAEVIDDFEAEIEFEEAVPGVTGLQWIDFEEHIEAIFPHDEEMVFDTGDHTGDAIKLRSSQMFDGVTARNQRILHNRIYMQDVGWHIDRIHLDGKQEKDNGDAFFWFISTHTDHGQHVLWPDGMTSDDQATKSDLEYEGRHLETYHVSSDASATQKVLDHLKGVPVQTLEFQGNMVFIMTPYPENAVDFTAQLEKMKALKPILEM